MAVLIHQLKKIYVGPDGSVVPVIDVPELLLGDGEQVAMIGSSGSGKTTLLHLIAGILSPDGGRILIGSDVDLGVSLVNLTVATVGPSAAEAAAEPTSETASARLHYRPGSGDRQNFPAGVVDLAQLTEARRDVFRGRSIGYIFQTHHLLPGFTALENVLLGMSFTGRPADRPWAEHLLQEVGLADRLNYKPSKLSVGQQQRVAVARALANRPRLVLADEPTGALDEHNAQQVLDLIRKLCTEVSASLLLVTHDLGIARQLPRTLVLSDINRAARGYVGAMG